MPLFWHRRDLRTVDNVGLDAATGDEPVIPVYVVDPAVFDRLGERQRAFFLECARALRERYRELDSDLVVRTGSAADALAEVAEEYDTDRVVFNEHYGPERRARERAVRERFDAESHTDLVLVDPESLAPRYPTHSQFHNDWERADKPAPRPEPEANDLASVEGDVDLPTADADIDLPEPGYEATSERLAAFLERGIHSYNDRRDDLSAAIAEPTGAVSRLSASLAAGAIGVREVWERAGEALAAAADGDEQRNAEKYRYELSWREHNYHLLAHNPRLHAEAYDPAPGEIEWRDHGGEAAADLAAWKRGETGFPLVDAGMRQLEREGYVHNRPRQLVASFLTKHLLVDWRVGAAWFRERLVDYDPASNEGNWQWIAGTGTDHVDVRIFDPVAQAAKYDGDADFVKEHVPELRDVPAEQVIEWPTLSAAERDRLAPEYPDPIVGRNEGYERAEAVLGRAFGNR